jgi:hypothetical protein
MPLPPPGELATLQNKAAAIQQAIDNSSGAAASSDASSSWWSTQSAMTMSAAILIFGAVIIGIAAYLIRNEKDSQLILRVLATILILTLTVFLIVAGYSDHQIAPAIGLLGTIAGYLLGKESKTAPPQPAQNS